jgi:choline-sulfatase
VILITRNLRLLTLGLFIILSASACKQASKLPELNQLNVVLIVIDTLGAKHLEAYNSELKNSPNIAALARAGVRFDRAYAPAPWTKPSIASIFTSKLPSQHKLRDLHDTLDPQAKTIASYLGEQGLLTFGRVSHVFLNKKEGFATGFQDYQVVNFRGNVHKAITSKTVSDQALKWLERRQADPQNKNFFMFLHYFDPHYNYQHHAQYDRTSGYSGPLKPGMDIRKLRQLIPQLTKADINYLVGLYHEEIAYTDAQIGRVIDQLKQNGMADNTLIIVTADHGEEFLEHDHIGHTRTLYDELINVPLIFYFPKYFKARVVSENVSTMDILPTLLSFDSKRSSADLFAGISLQSVLTGSNLPPADRQIFSEVDFKSSSIKAYKAGVKEQNLKLIFDKPTKQWELQDLIKDPAELNDQQQALPGDFKRLKPVLEGFMSNQGDLPSQSQEDSQSKTPEEVEQLKTLGYM